MPSDRTPLLASRPSGDSERSDRLAEAEDDALHGTGIGAGTALDPPQGRSPWASRLRELFLFIWALAATAAVVVLATWVQHRQQTSPHPDKPTGKRNLVFMVSDGMGPASLSLTRSFRQHVEGLPIDDTLTLDRHFWGTSRTRSTSSLVTDSAAGATAFACGEKSYNGAISILPDYSACGTVMEAAKRAGYTTGLVVTTLVTDATPACFASHVYLRVQQDEIALQEVGDGVLGRIVDLIFGGGRCYFLPNTTEGSCRPDDVDVTRIAQEKYGWSYVDDRAGFDNLAGGEEVTLPALGLFADVDVPFELDRRNMADVYPSLSEMAATALRALEKATEDSDQGFFLMIEGSRIDHAGHVNDPAAQVREVLEYDKTFQLVLNFLEQSDAEGMLVATSDHETGGLATAIQKPTDAGPVYGWHPEILRRANASAEHSALLLREYMTSSGAGAAGSTDLLRDWIDLNLVRGGLGISDASAAELDAVISSLAPPFPPEATTEVFAKMVSDRARIGWSTHGHSAIDVNIYSSGGPAAEPLRRNVENTDVGRFLRQYLDVEVDGITEELNTKLRAAAAAAGGSDGTEDVPARVEEKLAGLGDWELEGRPGAGWLRG